MAAKSYISSISTVPINKQHFAEQRIYAKFQFDILKTDRLVHIYTNRHKTDSAIYSTRYADHLDMYIYVYVYFIESPTYNSRC